MADIAELGLVIRSDGVVVAKNRLKDFEGQADRTEKRAAAMGAVIGRAFALIGAALSVGQIVNYTNTWTDLNSRVEIATGSMGQGAATMQRLSEMARRTYSSLELTAETFLLNARAMKDLGYNSGQTLDFVESVNNALVVSGAKGERAASVVNALSKAMALGKLSGDQLETVLASGGRVAEALADSMGVTVLELRALGAAGKITGTEIYGITTQLERLREEADSMPATIGDAAVLFGNSMLELVGKMDMAVDGSSRVAEAIIWAADNIDAAVPIVGGLATVLAIALIPQIAAATASFGLLTIAMLANPFVQIALVAGTLTGAMIYLNQQQGLAAQSAQTHAEALTTNANALETAKTSSQGFRDGLRSQITLQVAAAKAALDEAGAQYKAAQARAAFGQKFGDAMSIGAQLLGMPGPDGDYGAGRGAEYAADTMDRALAGINDAYGRLQDFEGQLSGLAEVEANYAPVVHTLGQVSGELVSTGTAASAANDNVKALATDGFGQLTQQTNGFASAARNAFSNLGSGFIEAFRKGGDVAANVLDMVIGKVGQLGENLMNNGLNGLLDMGINALMGAFGGFGMGSGMRGVSSITGRTGFFPGFADGTNYAPGGLAWVGERGPELVNLPRGSQVIPNGPSMAMAAPANNNFNMYATIHANSEQEGAAAARGWQAEMERWKRSGEGHAFVRKVVGNSGRVN